MRNFRNVVWLISALAGSFILIGCSSNLDAVANTNLQAEPPVGEQLTDEEATALMHNLLGSSQAEVTAAADKIIAAQDQRFIGVFIDLMRGLHLRLAPPGLYQIYIDALEELSGQQYGSDWPSWVEWYGTTDIEAPQGYTSWKGALFANIDPRFTDFLQDGFESTIRPEEIQWGGVCVDCIPALQNAMMIPGVEADYLLDEEPVFGLSINGDVRAYPLRQMDWHEMANDVVGGVPVSLAYCTLCGAGIAFDGRGPDGTNFTFGSSGLLYRSNKLMYDHQTNTLWNQLTGEPVLGELVEQDIQLNLLPVVLTTWGEWQAQHPDTLVLDINTGYSREYEPGAAYAAYFASSGTMFPVWQRSSLLADKDRIYALRVDGTPKAYPLDILAEAQVVNDVIGDVEVVLIAARGVVDVYSNTQRHGEISYNAGGEVRAYLRGGENFEPGTDVDTLADSSGRTWRVTEEGLVGPDGEFLERLPGHLAYWFGWFTFFPDTELYGLE